MRGAVAAALFGVAACLASGCLLDFDLPDDYVSTDPSKGCAANEKCKLECGSSVCAPSCGAGSQCVVECGSGVCTPSCGANATCTIDCGSGACQVTCSGTCAILKGSGAISCSGPGCP